MTRLCRAPVKKLLLVLLLFSCWVSADIYRWTDAAGRVHFGDEPHEKRDAQQITPKINTYEHIKYESPATTESATTRKVVMYSTRACPYCKKARTYFRNQGIPFVEYDIEKNQKAKRRYDKFGGRGVPVIFIGKKRLNGFSVASFSQVYR